MEFTHSFVTIRVTPHFKRTGLQVQVPVRAFFRANRGGLDHTDILQLQFARIVLFDGDCRLSSWYVVLSFFRMVPVR